MEERNELPQLPKGWAWATISEICNLINGRAFKPSDWSVQGLPIVRIQNLNNHNAEFNYCNFKVEDKYYIDSGQLLFAWSGTPETSFGAHIWKRGKAVLNQHIFRVQIDESCVDKIFLMHLLNNNVAEYVRKAHGTAGLAHITKGKFDSSFVALPPFPEQHRIVAKIEELFSDLDAGIAALQKTKTQLKRYRQAVLKAAVEGKLTAEWRAAHRGEIEPASALLEHIRAERAARRTSRGGAEYIQPQPDTPELGELPEGWLSVTLEELSWDAGYGTSVKCDYKYTGAPVLRIPNIAKGRIDITDLKYAADSDSNEFNDANALGKGDLIIVRTNGSRDLIGRGALVKQEFDRPHFFASYLIRFRLLNVGTVPLWVNTIWHSPRIRAWIETVAATTAGQYNVSMTVLNKLQLPLPPLAEQQQIVAEVERRLSVADETEKIVDASLAQAERLRQSILKRAFAGKLVPQDPSDEPAERLLERITVQRASNQTGSKQQTLPFAAGSGARRWNK